MTRLLVIGGSGFIGRSLLDLLVQTRADLDIHACYFSEKPTFAKSATWHQIDFLDRNAVQNIFHSIQPHFLIHLAWCSKHGVYWTDPLNLDWVSASLYAAKCFVNYGGKRCLIVGTSAEYDWSNNMPLSENSQISPRSLYGSSKGGLYSILTTYFSGKDVSFVWPRLFNPFGPFENPNRLIPRTCISLLKGMPMTFDHGNFCRDFLHVEDLCDALCRIFFSEYHGVINVGSGIPITIKEVVSVIAKYYKCENLIRFDENVSAVGIEGSIVSNIDLLEERLGWKPEKSFEERLHEVCEWWSADNLVNIQ